MRKKLSLLTPPRVFLRGCVLIAFFSIFLTTRADSQGSGTRSGAFVYTGNNGYSGSTTPISGYVINPAAGTLSGATGTPFAVPGRPLAIAGHP